MCVFLIRGKPGGSRSDRPAEHAANQQVLQSVRTPARDGGRGEGGRAGGEPFLAAAVVPRQAWAERQAAGSRKDAATGERNAKQHSCQQAAEPFLSPVDLGTHAPGCVYKNACGDARPRAEHGERSEPPHWAWIMVVG